jgi:hypothetical protein
MQYGFRDFGISHHTHTDCGVLTLYALGIEKYCRLKRFVET